jgi:hypothetical protein
MHGLQPQPSLTCPHPALPQKTVHGHQRPGARHRHLQPALWPDSGHCALLCWHDLHGGCSKLVVGTGRFLPAGLSSITPRLQTSDLKPPPPQISSLQVTCTATTASGSTATGTFTVTVRRPPGQENKARK